MFSKSRVAMAIALKAHFHSAFSFSRSIPAPASSYYLHQTSHYNRRSIMSNLRPRKSTISHSLFFSLKSTADGSRSDEKKDKESSSSQSDCSLRNIHIDSPEDMEDVGSLLSMVSKKGDVIFLDGDLGAGKTCFSRGFIRSKTGQFDMRVTSPTYLLSNVYSIGIDSTVREQDNEVIE